MPAAHRRRSRIALPTSAGAIAFAAWHCLGRSCGPIFARTATSTCWLSLHQGTTVGLIRLAGIERELSEMLGRKADTAHAGRSEPIFPRRGGSRR